MTLQEHARKIWNGSIIPTYGCFSWLRDSQKIPLFEAAYDELRKELEGADMALKRISVVSGVSAPNWDDLATLVNREIDRLRADLCKVRLVASVSPSMDRIADALGLDKGLQWSEIADKAIEKIKAVKQAEALLDDRAADGRRLRDALIRIEEALGVHGSWETIVDKAIEAIRDAKKVRSLSVDVATAESRVKGLAAEVERLRGFLLRIDEVLGGKPRSWGQIADGAVEKIKAVVESDGLREEREAEKKRMQDALGLIVGALGGSPPTWRRVAEMAVAEIREAGRLRTVRDRKIGELQAEVDRLRAWENRPAPASYEWLPDLGCNPVPSPLKRNGIRVGWVVVRKDGLYEGHVCEVGRIVLAKDLRQVCRAIEAVVRTNHGDAPMESK